jgi:hypothetical protein
MMVLASSEQGGQRGGNQKFSNPIFDLQDEYLKRLESEYSEMQTNKKVKKF